MSKTQSSPRFYDNDGRGPAAEYQRLAMQQLGLANHGDDAANYIAAAQVQMLAALLTYFAEEDTKYEAEREKREAEFAADQEKRTAELRDLFGPARPPVRIRVLHNTDGVAMATGFRPDDRVVEVYAYDDAVTAATTDLEIASRLFELFNIGDDPTFGEPDHRAVEYRDRHNRSLSIGDVIAIDGRYYTCAPVGWYPIQRPAMDNDPRPGTTPFHSPYIARK